MKQNNGMALPEDFVDMNDVETGYVDGKGPGGVAGGATCHLVKKVHFHIPGTFSDTFILEVDRKLTNTACPQRKQRYEAVTSLNTNGKVAVAANAIAAIAGTAGITCAILKVCGVFDKD